MFGLGGQANVEIWLAILVLAGLITLWEVGAIITHRWHTISFYASRRPWLAWLIGLIFLLAGIGLFLWFVFWHTRHLIPW